MSPTFPHSQVCPLSFHPLFIHFLITSNIISFSHCLRLSLQHPIQYLGGTVCPALTSDILTVNKQHFRQSAFWQSVFTQSCIANTEFVFTVFIALPKSHQKPEGIILVSATVLHSAR